MGQQGKDVVWIPSPNDVVELMLDLAHVTAQDYVVDLGSGDGRNVIAAAKRGARALGVEYNPELVELSKRAAADAGVADKASFVPAGRRWPHARQRNSVHREQGRLLGPRERRDDGRRDERPQDRHVDCKARSLAAWRTLVDGRYRKQRWYVSEHSTADGVPAPRKCCVDISVRCFDTYNNINHRTTRAVVFCNESSGFMTAIRIAFKLSAALCALALALVGGAAVAQPATAPEPEFPTKPIRFLVGVAPGGGTDFVARLLGQKLTEKWGQTVVTDNRTGATGLIAMELTARAAPDGYTYIVFNVAHLMAASLTRKATVDTEKDFAPVAGNQDHRRLSSDIP